MFKIPDESSTLEEIWDELASYGGVTYFDDSSINGIYPFFYQCYTEFGYYAYDIQPFKEFIKYADGQTPFLYLKILNQSTIQDCWRKLMIGLQMKERNLFTFMVEMIHGHQQEFV